MNAGGHIAVAARVVAAGAGMRAEPDHRPGLLLGAALPDLATIGRFRLLGATDDEDVTDGIALHHRTDDLFHRHRWFSERNRELTAELGEAGLGRGAAMACSHVGIELILDGRLARDEDIGAANDTAFEAIRPRLDALAPLVDPDRMAAWQHHLDRLSALRLPTDYHDAEAVAARLFRILRDRPRIALDENRVDDVAGALARRQPEIESSGLALVAELATALVA